MTNKKVLTPVIGMEIHVELRTASKMFCGCPADHFGVKPNTHTCPVCLGMPGALPVPNRKAIEWTTMIGLALGSTIANQSKFDRKHYYYPDLPKGYQISQYDEPLCVGGHIDTSEGTINITRVHLEEDTAKLQHTIVDGEEVSLIDFNRSGVALVEIVTDPDIHSSSQAKEYAQQIQQIIRFLGVSDADMEKGSMRVEANISWGLDLGYKVEVKNINSFRFLEKAIVYELARQKQLLDKGEVPTQETRGYNETKSSTYPQRTKEGAADYRYFPEPDIPPMIISNDQIEQTKSKMPALPKDLENLFVTKYQIRPDFAKILTSDKEKATFAIACLEMGKQSHIEHNDIANFLVNKVKTAPKTPTELIARIKNSTIPSSISNQELCEIISQTIEAQNELVAKYKSGKVSVLGALVGNVMRQTQGKADPKMVHSLLLEKLK